jgi:cell wall assembly regulator SMI1
MKWQAQLLGFIDAYEQMSQGVAATEKEIESAESELGITFPLELKAYLIVFGHLEIGHHELYGLGLNIPDYLSIVKETLLERHQFRPHIPVHLLPIQNDGAGNHYCLDLSVGIEDPPIVFWNHDGDETQTPDVVSSSFTSWLLEVANETLEA